MKFHNKASTQKQIKMINNNLVMERMSNHQNEEENFYSNYSNSLFKEFQYKINYLLFLICSCYAGC